MRTQIWQISSHGFESFTPERIGIEVVVPSEAAESVMLALRSIVAGESVEPSRLAPAREAGLGDPVTNEIGITRD